MTTNYRNVRGLSELQKFLDQLPVKMERSIMRGAMRAGAKVILVRAKSNINNVSGDLAKSLRITTRARGGRVYARVVAGGPKAGIGNRPIWVEYGTRSHIIRVDEKDLPVNARRSTKLGRIVKMSITTVNRSLRIGGMFVGKKVVHPGSRPHPFMRPALDQGARDAVLVAADYIKKRLTKAGLLGAASVDTSIEFEVDAQ